MKLFMWLLGGIGVASVVTSLPLMWIGGVGIQKTYLGLVPLQVDHLVFVELGLVLLTGGLLLIERAKA